MTRQRAKFKSKRRGDNAYAIATRFTCQRALCNRGKRQGDSPRVIATRFTCQRALCNRGKRQGDSQRVIDTDLVHGSSTWVQNRVQLKEKLSRSYEKLLELMSNYENLSETVKALCYVRQSIRDVPDPDSTIRYPVKCRHPVLSGIRVKFAGYLPDSTVT